MASFKPTQPHGECECTIATYVCNTVWHKNFKFYGFTVVGRTVKLKSINFYYCIAKILSYFDNCKI